MQPEIGMADIVVGILAAIGVVVLIVVFVWVYRTHIQKQ
jgi:hypothetical protein